MLTLALHKLFFAPFSGSRRPFYFLYTATFCIILFTLLLPVNGFTKPDSPRKIEKQRIERGIKRYRINIRRLQHGVRKQQQLIQKAREQERNLLAELEDIDSRLQEQKEKLTVLEERMTAQQMLINVKEKELNRVIKNKETVQEHLQRRISAYYKMGRIGLINVTFSAESLPSLLKFHDSFNYLIEYDQSVINTYKHTIEELSNAKELLTLERNLLKEFIIQAKEEEERIDETKKEKLTLLDHIKTQTKLHQQAIKELQKAAAHLTASLKHMQIKKETFQKGFILQKGKHSPPVKGLVLSRFNSKVANKLGISKTNQGIDIQVGNGTRVRAIFDGVITYAGYLRGYGNTVIINHGHDYFTIVSRLERLYGSKGRQVSKGDIIGITGDTAMIMEEGIHFEIRHGSKYLDPLLWLDTAQLRLPESNPKQ